MNRDHALFLLIGVLAGFITGYLVHEQVVGIQPPRIRPGDFQAAAATGAGQDADEAGDPAVAPPSAPSAAPQGGPPMAEIQRLRAILEKSPDDRDALLTLANLNFDIQSWPRAQELYEHLLRLEPQNADVMTDLGITLRNQGNFQRALELFRAARKVDPKHWQSRFNEAVVLAFDLKDFAGAEKLIAELESATPGNPEVARLAAEVKKLRESGG